MLKLTIVKLLFRTLLEAGDQHAVAGGGGARECGGELATHREHDRAPASRGEDNPLLIEHNLEHVTYYVITSLFPLPEIKVFFYGLGSIVRPLYKIASRNIYDA